MRCWSKMLKLFSSALTSSLMALPHAKSDDVISGRLARLGLANVYPQNLMRSVLGPCFAGE
ncbi:MAG: hypothetical protein RL001_670 [Pseudomonadota bacterium]|jgi:hypothetical protein